jgi:thiosulfate reductase cytochrome b subunit
MESTKTARTRESSGPSHRLSRPTTKLKSDPREETRSQRRPVHPLPIRLSHWINIPLLAIMAGSGLQIYAAYPNLGPRGALYRWYPLQGMTPPGWMRFGGWLAGARQWHFAIAWFLVLNGLIYVGYLMFSGEWRRRVFLPRRDGSGAIAMFAYYLRVRATAPPEDFYNGLQRLAYTSAIVFAVVAVFSGLAIYKPVQLHFLTALFGGYDFARVVHLGALVMLAMFTATHLVLVALHPRTIANMISGGPRG